MDSSMIISRIPLITRIVINGSSRCVEGDKEAAYDELVTRQAPFI